MESEKIILDIVVDVQKDFITGALANPAAQANVAHLADTAKAHAEAGHAAIRQVYTHEGGNLRGQPEPGGEEDRRQDEGRPHALSGRQDA